MDPKELEQSSALAWAIANDFVNENGHLLEFTDHRFLIDPFSDLSKDQVIMKSAQVGFSTMVILKSIHLAAYYGLNIGYILPTNNVVKDFVTPKVDPLIMKNKEIAKLVTKDSVSLKKFGDRFVYFRGSFSEREAIAISLDALMIDEVDRCDPAVLTTYLSRLQASKFQWNWQFSNPSVPGFGVHEQYQKSDQMHWMVTCRHCKDEWYLTFEDNVDMERKIYVCRKCKQELTDYDRKMGRWLAKYPDRKLRGYHVSQLMAPWVPASYIVEKYHTSNPEFFHNFVLGLPYMAAELIVDRETILRATAPGSITLQNVAIGVDNGITKHFVIGTPNGIFKYGKTESWEEIENLLLTYNAKMVIDANPYPTVPKKLVERYPNQVFLNYYVPDSRGLSTVRWQTGNKKGVVHSDRTKIIDLVASEIANSDILFTMRPHELEEYISHWTNMYRVVEKDTKGIDKGMWMTKEGRPDHYSHATVYYRLALARILQGGSGGIIRAKGPMKKQSVTVNQNAVESNIDLEKLVKSTNKPKRDWRHV